MSLSISPGLEILRTTPQLETTYNVVKIRIVMKGLVKYCIIFRCSLFSVIPDLKTEGRGLNIGLET